MSQRLPSTKLRNIGPVSSSWLAAVGVVTHADLVNRGAVPTYLAVRELPGVRPTLNLLWALAAAADDYDWRLITPATKKALRKELHEAGRSRAPGICAE